MVMYVSEDVCVVSPGGSTICRWELSKLLQGASVCHLICSVEGILTPPI